MRFFLIIVVLLCPIISFADNCETQRQAAQVAIKYVGTCQNALTTAEQQWNNAWSAWYAAYMLYLMNPTPQNERNLQNMENNLNFADNVVNFWTMELADAQMVASIAMDVLQSCEANQ